MKYTPLQRRKPLVSKSVLPRGPIKPKRRKVASAVEKFHLSLIASLPCIVCGATPVEVHHVRDGQGMGQRASHFDTIPLCAGCHRTGPEAFHAGPRVFEAKFGTEKELLAELHAYLNEFDRAFPGRG